MIIVFFTNRTQIRYIIIIRKHMKVTSSYSDVSQTEDAILKR